MSYEISNNNAKIRYINFLTRGTGNNFAHASLRFKYSILEKADNWNCVVSRFRIPLNTIPHNNEILNAVVLNPVGGGATINFDLNETFSIGAFFTQLNAMVGTSLNFIITDDGRAKIIYNNWSNFYITLDPRLANKLNFPLTLGDIGGGTTNGTSFTGSAVILDKTDQLDEIRLEITGLPTQSEFISAVVEGFVISDFLPASSYSMSKTGSNDTPLTESHTLTYTPRQDLILEPKVLRPINLVGSQPIYSMNIKAFAIYRDGSKNEIILAPDTVFSVKLEFLRKY